LLFRVEETERNLIVERSFVYIHDLPYRPVLQLSLPKNAIIKHARTTARFTF
jgi:hypothetical protein